MYIDYRSDVNYPTSDGNVIELQTNLDLDRARSSIVEGVRGIDGVKDVSIRRGLLPGTEMPAEGHNTLVVSKGDSRSWEGDLVPKIEALILRSMPSPPPKPPSTDHS